MTHLRKMMLEELQRRHYSEATTNYYIRHVERFARYFQRSPDRLGPRHIREYQAQLFSKQKLSPGAVTNHLCALRFFYIQTLKRPWSIADTPYPKKTHRLPTILSQEEVGQVIDAASTPFHRTIARGDRRWLIRVYLGRDQETNKRNYHNRTIHGSMREAQAYLTRKLREHDLGRDLEGAKISLNEYLDRWLETAVRPKVRAKTFQDYQGILRRYVGPILGERLLTEMRPLDLQTMYQQMSERGLSARTIRYPHVAVKSAMQQAVRWRLLLENPADGVKVRSKRETKRGP